MTAAVSRPAYSGVPISGGKVKANAVKATPAVCETGFVADQVRRKALCSAGAFRTEGRKVELRCGIGRIDRRSVDCLGECDSAEVYAHTCVGESECKIAIHASEAQNDQRRRDPFQTCVHQEALALDRVSAQVQIDPSARLSVEARWL
jgi:hypothetical protein